MRRPSKEQVSKVVNSQIDRAVDKQVAKIVSKMPLDEQTTIAYGFYDMDGIYADAIAEKMEDFLSFTDYSEDDTPDSTTAVNGAFGTNGRFDGLDNFQDENEMQVGDYNFSSFNELDFDHEFDEDYHPFFKKGFKSIGKKIKKVGKKISKGAKKIASKVKKGVKKITIKNIVKTVKKAVKDVGNFVKKGVLFIPRQSARGLMAVNFRGVASKMQHAKNLNDKKGASSKDKAWKKKLDKKWKALGGKNSWLWSAVKSGSKKKPLFCGAKCKQKLAKATGKKSGFLNANGQVIDYGKWELDPTRIKSLLKDGLGQSNIEPATATLIATGGAVVGSLIALVGGMKQSKSAEKMQKDALKVQKEADDKQYKLMAEQQNITKEEAKKQLDLVEKQITDELDPVNQILNNPNLTQEQKTEAVKQVQEVLAVKEGQKKSKILLFAGIGIAVILGVVFIMSGKKGSK
jgi:hypothetical protein